jgi:hypothetical protein
MTQHPKIMKTVPTTELSEDVVVHISQFLSVKSINVLSQCSKSYYAILTKPYTWKQLVLRDFPTFKYYLSDTNIHHAAFGKAPVVFWQKTYELVFFAKNPYNKLIYLSKLAKENKDIADIKKHLQLFKSNTTLEEIEPFEKPCKSNKLYKCLKSALVYTTMFVEKKVVNDDEDIGRDERTISMEAYFITPNAKIAIFNVEFFWDVYYSDTGVIDPDFECSITDLDTDEVFEMNSLEEGDLYRVAKYFGLEDLDAPKLLAHICCQKQLRRFSHHHENFILEWEDDYQDHLLEAQNNA